MTDVHAHLNDGRGTTVTTTVIHDHVDLRGATHHLVCRRVREPYTKRVQANPRASERASVRTDRGSFHRSARHPSEAVGEDVKDMK